MDHHDIKCGALVGCGRVPWTQSSSTASDCPEPEQAKVARGQISRARLLSERAIVSVPDIRFESI